MVSKLRKNAPGLTEDFFISLLSATWKNKRYPKKKKESEIDLSVLYGCMSLNPKYLI
jgi:hypothetical protein